MERLTLRHADGVWWLQVNDLIEPVWRLKDRETALGAAHRTAEDLGVPLNVISEVC